MQCVTVFILLLLSYTVSGEIAPTTTNQLMGGKFIGNFFSNNFINHKTGKKGKMRLCLTVHSWVHLWVYLWVYLWVFMGSFVSPFAAYRRMMQGRAPVCNLKHCGPGASNACDAPCKCSNNGEARRRGRCYGTIAKDYLTKWKSI